MILILKRVEGDFKQAVKPPPPCSASSSHSVCHLTNNDSFYSRVYERTDPHALHSSPPFKLREKMRSKKTKTYQKDIKHKNNNKN